MKQIQSKKLKLCLSLSLTVIGCFVGAESFADGYGLAGCGLGSQVVKTKEGFSQVLAATLNGTSGNQTFGITSGTSNCQESDRETAKLFIEVNKVALRKEAAQGAGETVVTLSKYYRCSDSSVLGTVLQKNHKEIFRSEKQTGQEIDSAIESALRKSSQTASVCKTLG